MNFNNLRFKKVDVIIGSGGALILTVGLLLLIFAFDNLNQETAEIKEYDRFLTIYEPSAADVLSDGRILLVEDEIYKPIHLLTFDSKLGFNSTALGTSNLAGLITGNDRREELDDLEGLAIDQQDRVYAVTSHSRTESGNRKSGREKLIRFTLQGDQMTGTLVYPNLADALTAEIATLGVVDKDLASLNVEALGLTPDSNHLLVGLRSPVVNENALVLVMENPDDVLEQGSLPSFSSKPWSLDLDKGGIRALVYDSELKGYLIVSRREDRKGKPFKLWFWSGDLSEDPRRISIAGIENINRAEGITPIVENGKRRLLIVFDDGKRVSRIGAHYRVVDYADLSID